MRHVRRRGRSSRTGERAHPVMALPLPRLSAENAPPPDVRVALPWPATTGIRRETALAGLLAAGAGLLVAVAVATRW